MGAQQRAQKHWDRLTSRSTSSWDGKYFTDHSGLMVHSYTCCAALGWDGMRWAVLVTQRISMDAFTFILSYQRSPSHRIPSQRVCKCTMKNVQCSEHILHWHSSVVCVSHFFNRLHVVTNADATNHTILHIRPFVCVVSLIIYANSVRLQLSNNLK